MEPLLRPWFAVVDQLLPSYALSPLGDGQQAPVWRVELYGGDAVGKARAVPVRGQIEIDDFLRPTEQRQLREAFELFALALRVDQAAFMAALARGMRWIQTAWTHQPFAANEYLKLQVIADLNADDDTDFFQHFLDDVRDATASDTYTCTRRALLALGDERLPSDSDSDARHTDIELLVQLNVVPGPYAPRELVDMLRRINRDVFFVSKIAVVVSPKIRPSGLTDVFRMVDSFRDVAQVEVFVDLPVVPADRSRLILWKGLFDVIARRPSARVSANDWTVTAVCGEPALDRRGAAKAATTTALLAALADVGDHVSAASVCMALQDAGSERGVRAKYLGYILRAGHLRRLTIKDQQLTNSDVDRILEVYNASTRRDVFRALWEPSWHGPANQKDTLPDKITTTMLTFPTEVLGTMQDLPHGAAEGTVDVFLAGFGQCGVNAALKKELQAVAVRTVTLPLAAPALTSLSLLFLRGPETVRAVQRLVKAVGHSLEKLQLEIENGAFTPAMVVSILEACPKLRKLHVKPLLLDMDQDRLSIPQPRARTPLEALTIELTGFSSAMQIRDLSDLIGKYASGLKNFELFAPPMMLTTPDVVAALETLLSERMPMVQKLRLIGFNSAFVRSLWRRDRTSLRHVRVLMLESISWTDADWTAFTDALGDASHPLAQSLHTLHLKLSGRERLTKLLDALTQNMHLMNVAIDVSGGVADPAKLIRNAQATNGRRVFRPSHTLSRRQKAAFLSGLTAANVPMATPVVASIFGFADATDSRFVRVHYGGAAPPSFF